MKKFIAILLLALSGCGISEDCIQGSGSRIFREVEVSAFDKIMVFPGISVILTQGDEFSATVEAGENFIGGVSVKVVDGLLKLSDDSGCNWVRKHGNVVVHVTAPSLTEIYSNTDRDIRSNGVLTYPTLRLYAMDTFGGVGTGDFHLSVENDLTYIAGNNIAAFYIDGQTDLLSVNFYNDMGRFEGENLIAKEVEVFHRSSNDMIVHPIAKLSGNIYSTGNVISVNQPPVVEVVEHFSGRVIFE